MADFIFMLTNKDRTIGDAEARLDEVLAAGITHIGFKDIGLPFERLQGLAQRIKQAGATLYLEVVSLDAESEKQSTQAAIKLGVDVLMGGTRPDVVLPLIAGTGIRYYPFPGKIMGHPSVLIGTIEEIAESAAHLAALPGVHGLDLLAYRFEGDVPGLMAAVVNVAAPKPVVIAGSIDRPDRIAAVLTSKAAGFTIGTAALDGAFAGAKDLPSQLGVVQALIRS
jgi:hypothetical protein